ncbi:hypothetical protein B0H63DRAFT_530361 [Podospora didyma]|uniref:Uncharacterized protein n=1 Tax=Podospora didyma TaxID=330526 RepID=A0AAE0P3N3_9PEZI|nr:hypothetical protein B0H63DRAFT_530361 [Podospora didyma]
MVHVSSAQSATGIHISPRGFAINSNAGQPRCLFHGTFFGQVWPPGYARSEAQKKHAIRVASDLWAIRTSINPTLTTKFVPNEATLAPMLTAFARAAAQMHSLRLVVLEIVQFPGFNHWYREPYVVEYAARGIRFRDHIVEPEWHSRGWEKWNDEQLLCKPRVILCFPDWRPSNPLLEVFRAISGNNFSADAVVAALLGRKWCFYGGEGFDNPNEDDADNENEENDGDNDDDYSNFMAMPTSMTTMIAARKPRVFGPSWMCMTRCDDKDDC